MPDEQRKLEILRELVRRKREREAAQPAIPDDTQHFKARYTIAVAPEKKKWTAGQEWEAFPKEQLIPIWAGGAQARQMKKVQLAKDWLEGRVVETDPMKLTQQGQLFFPPWEMEFRQALREPKGGGQDALALAEKVYGEYMDEQIESMLRDKTFGAKALNFFLVNGPRMAEFAIIGGVKGKGMAGAMRPGPGMPLPKAPIGFAPRLGAMAENAATRTILQMGRVQADKISRELDGESTPTAFRKAMVSEFIQNFTELLGDEVSRGVGGIAKARGWDKTSMYNVLRGVFSLRPFKAAGLDNMPAEVLEEFAADMSEWTAGTSNETLEDIAARWTDKEYLGVMLFGFSVIGGIGAPVRGMLAKAGAKARPGFEQRQGTFYEQVRKIEEEEQRTREQPPRIPYHIGAGPTLGRRAEVRREYDISAEIVNRILETRKTAPVEPREAKGRQKMAADSIKSILEETKNLRGEYQAVADAIKSVFRVTKPGEDRLAKYEKVVQDYEADPTTVTYADYKRARTRLEERDRPVLREMPEEKIEAIGAMLQDLIEQNNYKNERLAALYEDKVKAITEALRDSVETLHGQKHKPGIRGKTMTLFDKVANRVMRVIHNSYNYDTLLRAVSRPGTAGHDALLKALYRADLIDLPDFQEAGTQAVRDKMAELGVDVDSWETEVIELPVRTRSGAVATVLPFTRNEIAHLWTQLDDPDTFDQLIQKGAQGIKLSPRSAQAVELSPQMVLSLKNLTGLAEEERSRIIDFARFIKEEEIDGRIAKAFSSTEAEVRGKARPQRERYAPRVREREFLDKPASELVQYFRERQMSKATPLRARTGGLAPIKIESILKWHGRHNSTIGTYVTKMRANEMLQDVMSDREVRQAVRAAFVDGDHVLSRLMEHQKIWRGAERLPQKWLDRAMRSLVRKLHIGALSFNPPVGAYQQFSRLTVLSNQGADFSKYLFHAQTFSPKHIAAMDRWIRDNIAWLKQRFEGSAHGIVTPGVEDMAVAEKYGKQGGMLRKTLSRIGKAGMWHIHAADRFTIDQIGIAIKLKGIDLGLRGAELDAFLKDQLVTEVVKSQPSWDVLSISGWHIYAREHAWFKPFIMFTSQLNKHFNLSVQALQDFKDKYNEGTLRESDFGELGYKIAIPLLLNSFLVYMVRYGYEQFMNALTGYQDERKLQDHVVSYFQRVFGNLVGVGPLAGDIMNKIQARLRGRPSYPVASNAIADSVDAGASAIADAIASLGENESRRRDNGTRLAKAIENAMRAGMVGGFPGGVTSQWWRRATATTKRQRAE